MERERRQAAWRLRAVWLPEASQELQPEAWLASALLLDGQPAGSQAGLVSGRQAGSPEASDAHRARGAHRPGVRGARCLPEPHGVQGVQQELLEARREVPAQPPAAQMVPDAGQPVARRGAQVRRPVGSGVAAVQLQVPPDVPAQQQEALAALDVVRPEVRRGEPEQPRGALADAAQPVVRRAAEEAQPQAGRRGAARQPAAVPLVQPWARLQLQEGLPARAGSAHRYLMHEMS